MTKTKVDHGYILHGQIMLLNTLSVIVLYYINNHPSFILALSSNVIMKHQLQQQQRQQMLGIVLAGIAAVVTCIYYQKQKQDNDKKTRSTASTVSKNALYDPSGCIYLDYNGTTPVYPAVLEAMMPYLTTYYGNPSSSHLHGKEPRRAINEARYQILKLLGINKAPPSPSSSTSSSSKGCSKQQQVQHDEEHEKLLKSIWFTGCGTESDNLAIALALQSAEASGGKKIRKPYHIVTCNVEHPAIGGYLQNLESQDLIEVTYVKVQEDGRVLAKDVIDALQKDTTILCTIMLANNESGAIQPIKEISEACHTRNILFHTDAAQAAGKVSLDLKTLGHPDMVSIVGHKLGAPKGIACLYIRPECRLNLNHNHGILLIGGGQEFGRRGGTENTPYIVGFGLAAEMAANNLSKNQQYMENLRSKLLQNLQSSLGSDNVRANGPLSLFDTDTNNSCVLRLPNTLSVSFKNIHSGDLLGEIGHLVAASAGATCHSAGSVSSILKAMSVPEPFIRGTLRLSLGPATTSQDIDRASQIISDAVQKQWQQK